MRRSFALPVAALIGAASAAPISIAAVSSPQSTPDPAAPAAVEERYGIVRYDGTVRRWTILSTPAFQSAGLDGVSCSPASGVLTVTFTPLAGIGTFTVDEDDAYSGRYAAGAALTTRSMAITFRKAATGAVVSCNAAELRIADSGLQVWVRGTLAGPPTSTPTPPPPTRPTTQPPTSPSPSRPPTEPTTTPPPLPSSDPSDPADWPTSPPPPIG